MLDVIAGNFYLMSFGADLSSRTNCNLRVTITLANAVGMPPSVGTEVLLDVATAGFEPELERIITSSFGYVTTDKGSAELHGGLVRAEVVPTGTRL